jgi:hypothetical protein
MAGAGCGLGGLAAAQLGARVTLTDRPCVIPQMTENATLNQSASRHPVDVSALQWGSDDDADVVAALGPIDLVLAADCCYIDGVGISPSIEHFVRVAHALLRKPSDAAAPPAFEPRALIAWEQRSLEVQEQLLVWLHGQFARVTRVALDGLPATLRPDNIHVYDCRL